MNVSSAPTLVRSCCLFVAAAILSRALLWGEAPSPPAANPPDPNLTFTFSEFAAAKSIRLVAYGDMRFTDPSNTSVANPRIRKWLAARIAEEHPEVLLLTGDMPYTGAKAEDWQVFRNETSDWRAGHILQLPTPGNHETYGGKEQGIANYLSNFPDIAGHRFYSAVLGNVEVISLDCTSPTGKSSQQVRWFAAQLDHLPLPVDFLLILYHFPWMADEQSQVFAGQPTKDALLFRGILEARLARIRASIVVLNGHIHNYERFESRGVEYVVSGGGGAEPYPLLFRGGADLYHDTAFPVFHYLTLEVTGHKLHAVMWKVKDPEAATLSIEAKDQFTLTAPAKKVSPKARTGPGASRPAR